MKKRVFVWGFLIVLIIGAFSNSTANANEPAALPIIADGEWVGTLATHYDYGILDYSGTWQWSGDMGFVSQAGSINGEFGVSGVGSVISSDATVSASLNAIGAISGTSEFPTFQMLNGLIDSVGSSQGFTITDSTPIDPNFPVVPIDLMHVSCQQIDGQWDDFVYQFGTANNFTITAVDTVFSAVRVRDIPAGEQTTYQEELKDLIEKANAFQVNTKTNSLIDDNELRSLLSQAEKLAISLRANNDCGFTNEWSFSLPIAAVVAQLVDFAYNNPGFFTDYDLFLLSEAAVRSGVIGAGAVNPDLAKQVKDQLTELVSKRLEEIDKIGQSCAQLNTLLIASANIGGQLDLVVFSLKTKLGCK